MTLLSAKARRLVESAVAKLSDAQERRVWEEWSGSHVEVGQWDTPQTELPIPRKVADVAIFALSKMADDLARQIRADCLDEDEVVQLDNNLAYLGSIEELLTRNAG